MKTVAGCFKYADKIVAEFGPAALAALVANNRYNRQRLLRFAETCRVTVAAAEKARRQPAPVEQMDGGADDTPRSSRIWDRNLLEKQVWSERIDNWRRNTGSLM